MQTHFEVIRPLTINWPLRHLPLLLWLMFSPWSTVTFILQWPRGIISHGLPMRKDLIAWAECHPELSWEARAEIFVGTWPPWTYCRIYAFQASPKRIGYRKQDDLQLHECVCHYQALPHERKEKCDTGSGRVTGFLRHCHIRKRPENMVEIKTGVIIQEKGQPHSMCSRLGWQKCSASFANA